MVPFQREVFDSMTDPRYHKVVIQACAQLLKTQALLCYINYLVRCNPCPILCVQPTLGMAEAFSKERIDTSFRDNGIFETMRSWKRNERKFSRNVKHKSVPGGSVSIASAGSARELASRPIRVLLLDEVDRYAIIGEGDPIEIAQKRTTTFFDRKTVICSSPGDEALSKINHEYLQSDQRLFHVPCNHCGQEQVLLWENVKWDSEPSKAYYVCRQCGAKWDDGQKNANVQRGRWIAARQERNIAGFKINALYSPWQTIGELAEEFISAQTDIDRLRVFMNTRLAECWKDATEDVRSIVWANRLEEYNTTDAIPNNILLITMGVDCQGDRIEGEIVGWGIGDESWSLKYLKINGSPGTSILWEELAQYLDKRWTREDGVEMRINAMFIDNGYYQFAPEVLAFAYKHQHKNVRAIIGVSGFQKEIFNPTPARSKHRGLKFYRIGVDNAKSRLYRHFAIKEPGPGYCHFPLDRSDEYFEQLTAEQLVTRQKMGRTVKEWRVRDGVKHNEALDCRVYAMAARLSFSIDFDKRATSLDKKAKVIEKKEVIEKNETNPNEKSINTAKPRQLFRKQQRRNSFMGNVLRL